MRAISTDYPSADAALPHSIDLPHTSRIYKTLLQGGHFSHTSKAVERAPGWDAGTFAEQFVQTVGEDVTVGMCTRGEGNGAFVVAELCETLVRDTERTTARQKVKSWFGDDVRKAIEAGEAKGRKVLLEKLGLL